MPTSASASDRRLPVAVLGATGTVGQRLLSLLADHPWFRVEALMASERSAGKSYAEATRWMLPGGIPPQYAQMVVRPCEPDGAQPLVLSALDASVARELEPLCAAAGSVVISNASAHRMAADVPLVVPEVNAQHLDLLLHQQRGPGALITNPNCSTIGLVLALAPLQRAFGVRRVSLVTLQALSGAGLPGVPSLMAMDNIIPFIAGEEEKLAEETARILGSCADGVVTPASVSVSAQCNRVPVLDGHTLCVSVELGERVHETDVAHAWQTFEVSDDVRRLPSAPRRPLHLLPDVDAPQPRLHRNLEQGMAVALGRLRPCPVLHHRFVALVHNTLRGAAGGALLLAELAVARGHVPEADVLDLG